MSWERNKASVKRISVKMSNLMAVTLAPEMKTVCVQSCLCVLRALMLEWFISKLAHGEITQSDTRAGHRVTLWLGFGSSGCEKGSSAPEDVVHAHCSEIVLGLSFPHL